MLSLAQFALNFKYAFRPRKPLLTARLVQGVLRSILFPEPRLRYVDFALDFACNLKCEHCFAVALKDSKRRTMTVEDYARVAAEAMDLGAMNFSFQGGEPLLYKDLGRIIKACRPDRNVISVATNGTLLTAERIGQLKSCGVDILTVSLDSGDAREHDAFRGVSGTFESAMSGIAGAIKAGMRVTLGTVVTKSSLRSKGFAALLDISRKLDVILMLILPAPAGRWQNNRDILLGEDDLALIDRLTGSSPRIRTDFQANLKQEGCGAVKELLYITPYGDVLACPFMHISFGNVLDGPLADIRRRALQFSFFREYHPLCLVSTDSDFIEKYLSRTFGAEQLPILWDRVFSIEAHKNEG